MVGEVALVAGQLGEVLALDTRTGCAQWAFAADAQVRGAIAVADHPETGVTAWFVDNRSNAYALDAESGEPIWKVRVGWHAASSASGSVALHAGRLYVPVSTMEVVTAGDPGYECCTASGALAALDAATGETLWYHRVVPGYPEEAGRNEIGTRLWGPSGAPVWSSPTVDANRGVVYVGTGQNYTYPTTAKSDAILALDLATGERLWSFQATAQDAFTWRAWAPEDRIVRNRWARTTTSAWRP